MPPASSRARIAVLASGGGSNLQALLDYLHRLGDRRSADVQLVASNRAGVGALQRAADAGIDARVVDRDEGLASLVQPDAFDIVVLAGYVRLVPAEVVRRFRGRMLNVHPALLPAFGGRGMYGRHVHAAVLASGTTLSGPTVHFVDEHFDQGPIIAQWPVPVSPADTVETLAARVLRAEHLLLPRAVEAVAAGVVTLDELGRVSRPSISPDAWFAPADDAEAEAAIDRLLNRR